MPDHTVMLETLKSGAAFLRHYLEHYSVHVMVQDGKGNVSNSFTAVQIPDWAVKQRLDDIDYALGDARKTSLAAQPDDNS